jgi:uncharacterized damage-inducible protein DinB
MTLSEMLLPEFDEEMGNTRRLLACVPDGKSTWKPHDLSMTLGRLATHIAEIPGRWVVIILTRDEFDVRPPGPPPPRVTLESTAKILELLDRNAADARQALAAASDAEFGKPFTMLNGGKAYVTKPRLAMYRRMAMSHLIHHRAQLGVYLRLNGVEIPGMYGPSADDLAKAAR